MNRTIFETEYWRVELAYKQLYLGRSVVFLKRDCGSLSEVGSDEWDELHQVIKRFEEAARKAFGAVMFNWSCLMNNAYQAAQPKPFVHWHVRPRYDKPVEFAEQTFRDPNFGHHYDRDVETEATEDLALRVIERIRQVL